MPVVEQGLVEATHRAGIRYTANASALLQHARKLPRSVNIQDVLDEASQIIILGTHPPDHGDPAHENASKRLDLTLELAKDQWWRLPGSSFAHRVAYGSGKLIDGSRRGKGALTAVQCLGEHSNKYKGGLGFKAMWQPSNSASRGNATKKARGESGPIARGANVEMGSKISEVVHYLNVGVNDVPNEPSEPVSHLDVRGEAEGLLRGNFAAQVMNELEKQVEFASEQLDALVTQGHKSEVIGHDPSNDLARNLSE